MFSTMVFIVEDIKHNNIKVNGEGFDIGTFTEYFIPSFCVTVYKYQGADINENCNNSMDKRQFYTALSHTRKFEFIHLNFKELNNRYVTRVKSMLELTNSKFNSLYRNGKIYKIMFDDGRVYVGSTCEELNPRLRWHLSNKKSQVYKNRKNNPKTELVVTPPSAKKIFRKCRELLYQ